MSAELAIRCTAIHLLRSGKTPAEVAQEVERSLAWVYKWRKRYFDAGNWQALQDRSRAPKHAPNRPWPLPTSSKFDRAATTVTTLIAAWQIAGWRLPGSSGKLTNPMTKLFIFNSGQHTANRRFDNVLFYGSA